MPADQGAHEHQPPCRDLIEHRTHERGDADRHRAVLDVLDRGRARDEKLLSEVRDARTVVNLVAAAHDETRARAEKNAAQIDELRIWRAKVAAVSALGSGVGGAVVLGLSKLLGG